MSYEIVIEEAAPHHMAAVRRHVRPGELSGAWRPALDQVWAFLRRNSDLRTDGHNIIAYHHPAHPGEPMQVDFGVEVARLFQPEGEVIRTHTPAGLVVSTLHVGPYDTLGAAHAAIRGWSASTGRALGSVSWAIYGDWNEDPAKLDVRVVYLLA